MEPIGSLRAVLEAETASWKRDLGKAAGQLRASEKRMTRSLANLRAGFQRVASTILIMAGPAVIGALIKRQIALGDQFAKMSVRTGVAIESLSAWSFGAGLAGSSTETLEKSLIRLAANMRDAVITPTAEGARAFTELGIAVTDSAGRLRSSDAVFEEVAARFAEMADGPQKAAIAVKLFGRSGAELIPLLNNLESLSDEARRTGNIVSKEFALNAEQFNDSLTRMGSITGKFWREEIVGGIVPALNTWVESLNILIGAQERFSTIAMREQLKQLQGELELVIAGQGAFADATGLGGDQLERQAELMKQIADLQAQISASQASDAVNAAKRAGGAAALAPEITSTVTTAPKNPFAGAGQDTSFEDFLAGLRQREEALRTSLLTRQEIEQVAFGERLAQLLEARAFGEVTEAQFLLSREEIEREHQARLTEIANSGIQGRAEFEAASAASRVRSLIGFGAQELAAVANTDKRLFKLHKIFALADIAVNAPQAISAAIARGGGLPWGAAFGVLTAAKYIALAASARGAQFGGSTSPASVGGGSATPVFQAPQFPPAAPAFAASPQPGITVIFEGNFIGNQEFLDDVVIPSLGDFFNRDGVLFTSQHRQGTELLPA